MMNNLKFDKYLKCFQLSTNFLFYFGALMLLWVLYIDILFIFSIPANAIEPNFFNFGWEDGGSGWYSFNIWTTKFFMWLSIIVLIPYLIFFIKLRLWKKRDATTIIGCYFLVIFWLFLYLISISYTLVILFYFSIILVSGSFIAFYTMLWIFMKKYEYFAKVKIPN